MANEKKFTIKVDGIEKAYTAVEKLINALNQINDASAKVAVATEQATKATEQQTQTNTATEGSMKQISTQIEELKNKYESLSESARNNSETGGVLLEQIQQLSSEYKSLGDDFNTFSTKIDGLVESGKNMKTVFAAGSNIISLFGTESENAKNVIADFGKIVEVVNSLQAINNIIQTKGTLTNTLYTKALQTVGLAKKQDTAAIAANTAAQGANSAATGGATIATQTFGKALIATGIGAIVVGLGMLIANFDKLKEYAYKLIPGLEGAAKGLDELKSMAMGVGEAFMTYVLTPFRVIKAVVEKVMQKDIIGAFKSAGEEVKKAFAVQENYTRGFQAQQLKNEKANNIEKAKLKAEELDNQIKDNEAKLGSDWKYTEDGIKAYKDLFEQKKILYADDKEASANLRREEWAYLREVEEKGNAGVQKAKERSSARIDTTERELETYKKTWRHSIRKPINWNSTMSKEPWTSKKKRR